MNKYNTREAIRAQDEYCRREGLPIFAPSFDGRCYYCGGDIYKEIVHPNGSTTGIPVKEAGAELITACPHCHYSFVE